MYSIEYFYALGVLAGSTSYSSTGSVTGSAAYEFQGGRKVRTTRYDASSALAGWVTFEYDPVSGLRTGSTVHDADGVVTGGSTRTVEGGRLTEVTVVNGTTVMYRTFTYEDGPNVIDSEIFFEF
jgi:hypothetical protein